MDFKQVFDNRIAQRAAWFARGPVDEERARFPPRTAPPIKAVCDSNSFTPPICTSTARSPRSASRTLRSPRPSPTPADGGRAADRGDDRQRREIPHRRRRRLRRRLARRLHRPVLRARIRQARSRGRDDLHRQGQSRRRERDVARRSTIPEACTCSTHARARRSSSKSCASRCTAAASPSAGRPRISCRAIAARREGWLNIGLLHTSLDGARGHDPYAPCTVQDLARFGYDYWALGHIHAAEIVARDPWVVYPGNVQGRSPRETGPKGAMRVTVEDGRIVSVEPFALDAARWAHERVDVAGPRRGGSRAGAHRRRARGGAGGGRRPPARRPPDLDRRDGRARAASSRAARRCRTRRARAASPSPRDCWVEQLRLETRAAAASAAAADPDALDIAALVAAAADDPRIRRRGRGTRGERRRQAAARVARRVPGRRARAPRAALARDLLVGSARMRLERLDLAPYGRFADRSAAAFPRRRAACRARRQ